MLESLLEFLIQGVVLGGLYALFAVGLSLIFGVLDVINVAHGEFFALGGDVTLPAVVPPHLTPSPPTPRSPRPAAPCPSRRSCCCTCPARWACWARRSERSFSASPSTRC